MKKVHYMLSFLLFLSLNAVAQNAVSKGKFIIEPYYGAPNFGKSLAKKVQNNNDNLVLGSVKGIGPAGVRFEYLLADKVGLGLDVIYNSFGFKSFRYDSLNNDGSLYKVYTGDANMSRIRVQLRFNYHFAQTEKVDAYVGVGAGSNTRTWKLNVNDTDFNQDVFTGAGTLLPVSLRVATGIRYYFIPNLGLNAEIGIGGPLISAGVSIKI